MTMPLAPVVLCPQVVTCHMVLVVMTLVCPQVIFASCCEESYSAATEFQPEWKIKQYLNECDYSLAQKNKTTPNINMENPEREKPR